jgi:DNA topoisomerase-1
MLRRLRNRRGGPEELLAYRSGRVWHRLGSDGINDYIKAAVGPAFSAKEFRTWNATVLAAVALAADPSPPASQRGRDRAIVAAVKAVSVQLGNTPAVARRAYVDPRVLDRYRSGSTIDLDAATRHAHRDHETSPLGALPDRRRRRLELAVLDLID